MANSKINRVLTAIRDTFRFVRRTGSSSSEETESADSVVLNLKIATSDFGVASIDVSDTEIGQYVKSMALETFAKTSNHPFFTYSSESIEEMINNFKLIRSKTMKLVDDYDCLKDLKVRSNEEFLMTARRSPVDESLDRKNLARPTEFQILQKTARIKKTISRPPVNINHLLLNDDMRKVFVTLAQESAYVLAMTSYGDKLIDYYRRRIHNYIKNHSNAVKVMVQLGFPLDRVEHAMKLKANNYKAALDWLIDNETTSEMIEELQPSIPERRRSSLVKSARRNSILATRYEIATNLAERTFGLLEIVTFYAEKDELVYQENINEMVHMGYEAEIAREALRITRNNVAAAIANIHGEDNPSISELRDGLSSSSIIRQKLLESPQILISLGIPQSFHFFVNILDNDEQANSWHPFTTIGALMTHIIITYQEEKHVCATNQFNGSRIPISALSAPN